MSNKKIKVEGGHTLDLSDFTHFAPSPFNPRPGWFVCFSLEKCESCGATIWNSADSTPNLGTDPQVLRDMGLIELDKVPADLVAEFEPEEVFGCENCM